MLLLVKGQLSLAHRWNFMMLKVHGSFFFLGGVGALTVFQVCKQNLNEVGSQIIPILQMGKRRHRKLYNSCKVM